MKCCIWNFKVSIKIVLLKSYISVCFESCFTSKLKKLLKASVCKENRICLQTVGDLV